MRRGPLPGRLGPRSIHQLPLPGKSAPFVCYALPPRRVGPVPLRDWWCGFGSGTTLVEAHRRAGAEIIERASAVFQGHEPRRRATLLELGEEAVAPDRFLLFSDQQRRARGGQRSPMLRVPPMLPPDEPIDWTQVRSLTEQRWKQLPTMAVYFKAPVPRGKGYCPADSNGLAAGQTRTEATLRALLELIERDSIALWWYRRIPRPAFPAGPDPRVHRLLDYYASLGRVTWLLDLTSDLGIPVCGAVSQEGNTGGDLAFGFGAALTRASAARHALLELAQPLATRAAGWPAGEGTAPFERWRRIRRHSPPAWLCPARGRGRAGNLPEGAGPTGSPLARCRRAVEAAGLEVLAVDLTRPDTGMPVVRVIVPGLRHLWPRFAPGRLYQAPERAGWVRRTGGIVKLNPVPLLV